MNIYKKIVLLLFLFFFLPSRNVYASHYIMQAIETVGTLTEPFKAHLTKSFTLSGGDLSYAALYLLKLQASRSIPAGKQKNIIEAFDALHLFSHLYYHYPQKKGACFYGFVGAAVATPFLKTHFKEKLTNFFIAYHPFSKAHIVSHVTVEALLYSVQIAALSAFFYDRDLPFSTFLKSATLGFIGGCATSCFTKNSSPFSLPLYLSTGILHNRLRCFDLSTPQTSHFIDLR